jgi:hypothetical protein
MLASTLCITFDVLCSKALGTPASKHIETSEFDLGRSIHAANFCIVLAAIPNLFSRVRLEQTLMTSPVGPSGLFCCGRQHPAMETSASSCVQTYFYRILGCRVNNHLVRMWFLCSFSSIPSAIVCILIRGVTQVIARRSGFGPVILTMVAEITAVLTFSDSRSVKTALRILTTGALSV